AATLLGYLLTTVPVAWVSKRLFPCPYPFGRAAGVLAWAGAVSALGCAMPAWALAVRLPLKAALVAAYVLGSFLFGLVTRTDLATVSAMIGARLGRLRTGTA